MIKTYIYLHAHTYIYIYNYVFVLKEEEEEYGKDTRETGIVTKRRRTRKRK